MIFRVTFPKNGDVYLEYSHYPSKEDLKKYLEDRDDYVRLTGLKYDKFILAVDEIDDCNIEEVKLSRRNQMNMYVPPECQGQMVTYSYGCDRDNAYMKVYDASDRSVQWFYCSWDDISPDINWDPNNIEPSGIDWKSCNEPKEES